MTVSDGVSPSPKRGGGGGAGSAPLNLPLNCRILYKYIKYKHSTVKGIKKVIESKSSAKSLLQTTYLP